MSGNSQPLFNEDLGDPEKAHSLSISAFRRAIVRWTHALAAITAAAARNYLVGVHLILALVSAGSWLTRSEVGHWDYVRRHAFELGDDGFTLCSCPLRVRDSQQLPR
jgi:hypothetical protein